MRARAAEVADEKILLRIPLSPCHKTIDSQLDLLAKLLNKRRGNKLETIYKYVTRGEY